MDTILGMELPLLVKFVLSFAIVLLLIGAAAMAVRKFGGKTLIPGAAMRGRQPRLAIIDRAPVDSRRSLVIVRRDNVEHLLLIGGPTDVLVEANIPAAAVQPVREPEPEVRAPAIEPAATRPPAVAPVAAPPVVEAPAESEPAIKPEPRLDVRTEPDLLPEPRPEPEVQLPHVPAFAPAPPAVAARKEVAATDVFIEPRQPNLPPPVAVPPLPAAAPVAQAPDDALARFAQDLDAHRDHINGEALAQKLAAQAPPVPPIAQAVPGRPIEPTFSEDRNLADMALRLEAALRRPLGNGARPVPQQPPQPQAVPRPDAIISVRQPQPVRRAPTVSVVPPPQATPGVAPPVVAIPPAAPTADEAEAGTYENLQREMASLLGRKPGSS